ncbi:hypothetical protein GQ53DRAFT_160655 [Thozetella sp. PMI_491]|nr:hypothetical protein GQ53DRAFT_160655 [Thozetella sp. PMI_491]
MLSFFGFLSISSTGNPTSLGAMPMAHLEFACGYCTHLWPLQVGLHHRGTDGYGIFFIFFIFRHLELGSGLSYLLCIHYQLDLFAGGLESGKEPGTFTTGTSRG